jgi:putative membrane protein
VSRWDRRDGRLQRRLAAGYALVWAVLAVAPLDRQTWLLENLLVFGFAAVLLALRGRFRFSNLSALLITAFLLLHVVGAHYTYSSVPIGLWVRDGLELSRNHYDRFVHFSFGLLMGYPLREIALRVVHAHRLWSTVVPLLAVLAVSSSYEILEAWAARVVDPGVGMAFVGAQGDVWDGQKDMTLALAGAIVAMAVTDAARRATGHEPYVRWLPA